MCRSFQDLPSVRLQTRTPTQANAVISGGTCEIYLFIYFFQSHRRFRPREASCDVIKTPKSSRIHARRTRARPKTSRLPTDVAEKDGAERFRAISPSRVTLRERKREKLRKLQIPGGKKAAAKSTFLDATLTEKNLHEILYGLCDTRRVSWNVSRYDISVISPHL